MTIVMHGPVLDSMPLSVCSDCVQMIANAEGSEAHAERLTDEWPGAWLVPSAEAAEPEALGFDTFPCDGCASPLAGDRFAATALIEPSEVVPA